MDKVVGLVTFGLILIIMIYMLLYSMKLFSYLLSRINELPDNSEGEHIRLGALMIHFIAEAFLIIYSIIRLVLVFAS